jgi:3-oxoadipate enol-lactonase
MPYARTRLGRFFYEERGTLPKPEAPAVILLHGFLFDGRQWKHQVDPIGETTRTIIFDGPGHGKTEDPPRFSLEDHAEALLDAMNELEVKKAIIAGLSWGGMVGMRFALSHPDRTAGLCLLDTSAHAESLVNRIKYRGLLSLHRRTGVPMSLYNRAVAPLLFGPRTLRDNAALVEESGRNGLGFSRDGVARAGLAVVVKRSDISDEISRITAPTLVMCGTDDRSTPPDRSRFIVNNIPHARMGWVEDSGHMSALEQPEKVNRELVPFIKGLMP